MSKRNRRQLNDAIFFIRLGTWIVDLIRDAVHEARNRRRARRRRKK